MKVKNIRILKFLIIMLSLSPMTSIYSTDDRFFSYEDFESFLAWVFDNNNQSLEQIPSILEQDPILIGDINTNMSDADLFEDFSHYDLPRIRIGNPMNYD